MNNFVARDYLAFLIIIVLLIFKLTGNNGSLDVSVAIILGYYFAKRDDKKISKK